MRGWELPAVYAKTAERWNDDRRAWGDCDGIAAGASVVVVSSPDGQFVNCPYEELAIVC